MNIIRCTNYEQMSSNAADDIVSSLIINKNLLLCAATGNSPLGIYDRLVSTASYENERFQELRIIKLDEWGGLPSNHPVTCEYYLNEKLISRLNIEPEKYISFQSNPLDAEEEISRIQNELDIQGPIDICILGFGQNGHIGFNEPGSFLQPFCHIAHLTEESLDHSMIKSLQQKPNYGLTLGMRDILNSKKIILLITGKNKTESIDKFLSRRITTGCPASFLWLHQNVNCYIDRSSCPV